MRVFSCIRVLLFFWLGRPLVWTRVIKLKKISAINGIIREIMPEKEDKIISMQDNTRASLRIKVNTNLTKCYKFQDYKFGQYLAPTELSSKKL